MSRLFTFCLLTLVLVHALRPATAQAPDDIERASERLRASLREGPPESRIAAIEASVAISDARVVAAMRLGLDDRQPLAVREAAIDALGRMEHPDALEALHVLYLRDRELREHEGLATLLYKAMGRHGDASSVPLLGEASLRLPTRGCGVARIMALGNIRDRTAIEALLRMARRTGGRPYGVASSSHGRFVEAFRSSLCALTGQDHGTDTGDWQRWWRERGAKFEVPAARPPVTADVRASWQRFWGEAYGGEPAPGAFRTPPFDVVAKPSEERVALARSEILDAFKSRKPEAMIEAIEAHGAVADKGVIHEVARGFRSRDGRVRRVTARLLGWNPSRRALQQLHRQFQRYRDWDGREDEFAVLLKAIGRHGDEASVEVLSAYPFRNLTLATGRARALGLGRIRSTEAVETLIQAMSLANNARGTLVWANERPRFMDVARISLISLTGVDMGESKDAWQRWWRENKREFEVEERRAPLPPVLRKRWEEYWQEPYDRGGLTR